MITKRESFWISNLLFVTFFWGTTFVLVKQATNDISVTWFLFYRFSFSFVLGTFILLLFLLLYDSKYLSLTYIFQILKSKGIILGFLLYLSYFFQTFGLQETTPSNAAFITGLSVILVPLFLVLKGKKFRKHIILANILATIGLGLLTINFSNFSINIGDIIILGTAVSIALQIIFTDIFVKNEPVLILIMSQFLSMTVLSIISAIILENSSFISINYFSEIIWIALLITVIFATLYAFIVQTLAQKDSIDPSTIAIIFAFEPIFALLYSLAIGEEILELIRLVGMILILLAIYIVIKKEVVISHQEIRHVAEL